MHMHKFYHKKKKGKERAKTLKNTTVLTVTMELYITMTMI